MALKIMVPNNGSDEDLIEVRLEDGVIRLTPKNQISLRIKKEDLDEALALVKPSDPWA